jgi:hypothetical protein
MIRKWGYPRQTIEPETCHVLRGIPFSAASHLK